jgi:O-antigen/teichoic acid export membrane protein
LKNAPGLISRLNVRKNVGFAVTEFAISTALLFFSYRLVIQYGGIEAVGVWATLYAWTNLVRLGDAGIAAATTRYLALWDVNEDAHRVRTYAETALLTNIVQFGCLALLAFGLLSSFLDRLVGSAHAVQATQVLPWLLLGFFCLNVAGTVLGALQGLHLGYRRSQLLMLGTTIQLLAVVVLVPVHGLVGLAWAQILQHGTISLLGWYLVTRTMRAHLLPRRFDFLAFRDMLNYSLKAQLVNVANGLVEPVSKMLVGHFGGMGAQGLFELAYKTVLVPRNLLGAGVTALTPSMTALGQQGADDLRQLYVRLWRFSVLSMLIAAAALAVLAPVPSFLWLGRIDGTYWLYVILLAGGFIVNATGIAAYISGMASGEMRLNILSTLITLATLCSFGAGLGLIFGAKGVVAATAIAIAIGGMTIWLLGRSVLATPRVEAEQ